MNTKIVFDNERIIHIDQENILTLTYIKEKSNIANVNKKNQDNLLPPQK